LTKKKKNVKLFFWATVNLIGLTPNKLDTDAKIMKGKKGNYDSFYNVQISCNPQQVILHSHVCQANNDRQQLITNIEGVEKNTNKKVEKAVVDAGYNSFDNLDYLEQRGIEGFIAAPDTTYKNKPYHKAHFKIDKKK